MPPSPYYCRWWFALILVATSAAAGASCFVGLHALESADEPEFWFYIRTWTCLGAATGFAAWYLARLVARRRATVRAIATLLTPAYLFVVFLGLDKNPVIAVLATIVFGFVMFMTMLANKSKSSTTPHDESLPSTCK